MLLTRIGSIGINTGIAFAGVTTIVTLNTANDALSIGATVNVGSGITLGASGDIFATGVSTFSGNLKVGSGVTISPDGDGFYTGVVTATTFSGALAASNLTGALPAISGANLTNLDASDLASGTVPTARLGSGTASSSTFLRGDSTFAAVTSTTINSNTDNYLITGTGTANTLQGEANLTFDGDDLLIRSSTDGRRISFATDGTSHYMKYDDTLSGIILNGYGGIAFETNGTNERLRIDASGRLVIGHTSNIGIANHNGRFQLHGTDYDTATMSIVHNGNASHGPFLFFASQRSGSPGGSTVLQNNDSVGTIRFHAGDGTDMASYCAAIQVNIDGTPGSNDVPGRITFSTTADGAATPTERLRIDSAGKVGLGRNDPAFLLDIKGAGYSTLRLNNSSETGHGSHDVRIVGGGSNYQNIYFEGSTLTFNTYNGSSVGERFRIRSTGGVTFNGDTADANALDDYEEGTFTISFPGGVVITNNEMAYTRIGRLVTCTGRITFATSGSNSIVNLQGLPFTPNANLGNSAQGGVIPEHTKSSNDNPPFFMAVEASANTIRIRNRNSGALTISQCSGQSFRFILSYFA